MREANKQDLIQETAAQMYKTNWLFDCYPVESASVGLKLMHCPAAVGNLRSNFEGARADSDALRQCQLISAFRRNKDLKDLLVHTNFNKKTPNREAPRVSKVGFIRLPHICNPFSRAGANLGQALTPNTKNAVYAVRCRACQRLCGGDTE
ncbi:hypothetical protein F7725_001064 [Dissostichus mawsoni]|uniref:Uncharacterized protein n=1 Tax=Dissostichus mawsoni TaxID=36200 RepID=A0A7J5ZIL9_DISMA|nr:hypothetical protein F7725_001064 [Dissostichus mawsoni]